MEDWVEESLSDDEDRTEIENELYSMFYYHSVSEGLPEELSKKYCLDADDFGVTISLKDTSCVELTKQDKSNSSINLENETSCANERYVDRGKGSKRAPSKTVKDSDYKGKTTKEVNADKPLKIIRLPENKSFDGRSHLINKFQSCRYYSETIKTNKDLSGYSKHKRNDFSNRLFQDKNVSSSTPITKRILNGPKQPIKKKHKLQPEKATVSSKNNDIVIDLTQEYTNSRFKNKRPLNKETTAPMITISSDSSDNSESDLDLSYSSSDSEYTNETFDLMLNTSTPPDRNLCDISYINTDYDWKKTSSPEGWTLSMRKFYNKPSKKLLNFDYKDVLNEMRRQGLGEWSICNADLLKLKSSRRMRCLRCQQEGHLKANCTKVLSCHMCGTPGHSFKQCPSKICLKCGSKCHDVFPRSCANCANEKKMACSICGLNGHSSKLCTSAWSSVSSQTLSEGSQESTRTVTKYCCNCGKSGHYYEDCRKPSNYSHASGDQINSKKGGKVKKGNKMNFKKGERANHWKHRKSMKNRYNLSFDEKRVNFNAKSNFRSRLFKLRKKNYDGLSTCPSIKNTKNRKISRRIMMLRKSNKRNNGNTSRLSHTL